MLRIILGWISRVLSSKDILALIFLLLEYLARNTKTEIDDRLVEQIKQLLLDKVH